MSILSAMFNVRSSDENTDRDNKEVFLNQKLVSLANIFRKKAEPICGVKIHIVDEALYFGSARTLPEDATITVVYDRETLDSLFGVSFFTYLYGDRVQLVEYHNAFTKNDNISPSDETVILGVEVSPEDLVKLNEKTKEIRIFAYRGSFDYLYDKDVQKNYENVTLFQSDNDYFIGAKNIGQLENSVAMMIKILYFYSNEWSLWKQHRYAVPVAHYTSFYPNIPEYNLTKAVYTVKKIKDEQGKEKAVAQIHNHIGALLWDFKTKLEGALNSKEKMHEVIPQLNPSEHQVYIQRLRTHIERTRRLQGWLGKGIIVGDREYAHCVPAISFAVQDIISLSCATVDTTVCAEDIGEHTIYYVYSKKKGKAISVANVINGEHTWMMGNIICVSKMKNQNQGR